VSIHDRVRGPIDFPAEDLDDFVLRRRDGRVTYNFAVVVDDVTMEISHVIRGAGHLSNTPKQALLFDALGVPRPTFVHLPNVLAPDGGKLSKRKGAPGVEELRRRGMLPEAIVNYLSLLGWSHPDEKEVLSVAELVADIDLDRIRASEMAYDPAKLQWVAGQHFAELPGEAVVEEVRKRLDRDRYPLPEAGLPAAVDALRSRMAAFGDFDTHLPLLYPEDEVWTRTRGALRGDPSARGVVEGAIGEVEGLVPWSRDEIKAAFKRVGESRGVRGRALFHPLRMALFGADSGPDLGALSEAVGREEVLRRLRDALSGADGRAPR
jgi:glutamyl/glutaminyl-tRNA synthetase